MQTLTQFQTLVVPPGKNTVEFKLIFTKEEFELARDLCIEEGYPLWDQLKAEHPVADRLEDLHMMMLLLEKKVGPKEREWKQGFFDREYRQEFPTTPSDIPA